MSFYSRERIKHVMTFLTGEVVFMENQIEDKIQHFNKILIDLQQHTNGKKEEDVEKLGKFVNYLVYFIYK